VIISASRRTDIPAFYSRWFLRRIEEGCCEWIHPFGGQLSRVSLRPEDCLAIVFWTRNPAPLFPALKDLRAAGHHFYFQFTVTGYPRALETHNPPLDVSLRRMRELAELAGPEAVTWRYDPIVLSSVTPPEYHLERFAGIAGEIEGATRRAYFSFVDSYGKTRKNFEKVTREHGVTFTDPSPEEKRELALRLRDLAAEHGMALFACCEDALVGDGIEKGHCVDIDRVRELRSRAGAGEIGEHLTRRPTREECGCTESVDIGAYDTCIFGCAYCYATRSREIALARFRAHDPAAPLLYRPPGSESTAR